MDGKMTEAEIKTRAIELEQRYKDLGEEWPLIISAEELLRLSSDGELEGFTKFMKDIGIRATKESRAR